MRWSHPLAQISPARRPGVFAALVVATLTLLALFQVLDAPIHTGAAPLGIVSLELAGSVGAVESMLASWGAAGQIRSSFGLGLDYLFMPIYATAIGLGCLWAGEILGKRGWPIAGAGVALAWGLWLAALCDATENLALITMMFGALSDPWPQLSFWCASVKFALIALGLLYAVYGLAGGIAGRRSAGPKFGGAR